RGIDGADERAAIRELHLEGRLAGYRDLAVAGEPAANKRSDHDADAPGKSAPARAEEGAGCGGADGDARTGRRSRLFRFVDHARSNRVTKVDLRVFRRDGVPVEMELILAKFTFRAGRKAAASNLYVGH